MSFDEELIRVCLKKLKESANRIETLNNYDIDPNYRNEIKKQVAKEMQKQIKEYTKTFELLDKYFSEDKNETNFAPSVKSIEEKMWKKAIINDKKIKTLKSLGILIEKDRELDIDNLELISNLQNNVTPANKLEVEYDTIENLLSHIEIDSDKNQSLKDIKGINSYIDFYTKTSNINEEEKETEMEERIDNFINTYYLFKNKVDLIKDDFSNKNFSDKNIDDFINLYQIFKQYKNNSNDIILNPVKEKSTNKNIENPIIYKAEIESHKDELLNDLNNFNINKVICPKCMNVIPFKNVCEICGYKLIETNNINNSIYKEYRESNDFRQIKKNVLPSKEETIVEKNDVNQAAEISKKTSNLITINKEESSNEIKSNVIENNLGSVKVEQIKEEESNIILKYTDNFIMTVGGMTSLGGFYLLLSHFLIPIKVSGLDLAINTIISITDFFPGMFVPLYNLSLFQPYIIGLVFFVIGINLMLVVIGMKKESILFKKIAIIIFLLATFFDVIRFISNGFLNAPWSLLGLIPNIIMLYYLFNRESLSFDFLQ